MSSVFFRWNSGPQLTIVRKFCVPRTNCSAGKYAQVLLQLGNVAKQVNRIKKKSLSLSEAKKKE